MDPALAYYGLDLLAVALGLYALLHIGTRRTSAVAALLLAHVLWLATGAPWTHVAAVLLVDVVFAARCYQVRQRRRHIARQSATRRLSRSAQGIDVLC